MHTHIKKYGSLFLLLLFLFPIVEKEFHIFDHLDDNHCVAADKHFHEMEHHCSICEFTIVDSCPVPDSYLEMIISEHRFSFISVSESVHVLTPFQDLPSRAPPTV